MEQGLVLMVVGMATVFFLLTLLVFLLYASAAFFSSWPQDEPETKTGGNNEPDELELIAIALAAIERSRA